MPRFPRIGMRVQLPVSHLEMSTGNDFVDYQWHTSQVIEHHTLHPCPARFPSGAGIFKEPKPER